MSGCYRCGNATEGSSYCSSACRELDYQQAPISPEFSPYLSPVPPLVSSSSAKSACSTPPSSATNSPLQSSSSNDLAEPPSLDLPPPKDSYYANSLPANGIRVPATWTINYQPEPLVSPLVTPFDVAQNNKDLSYRRKLGRPHPTVPSPLYFRQKAAAVHSSPALNPVSPSSASRSPFFSYDSSGANIHDDDITDLALPKQKQVKSQTSSTFLPTPNHCGRPGCVGVPKKLRVETNSEKKVRRKSWQPAPPKPFKGFTPIDQTPPDDLLVSPRIRTLRTGRSASDEGPSVKTSRRSGCHDEGSDSDSSGDDHSAFACYLFSHLADPSAKPKDQRGRPSEPTDSEEMKRSRSVDGVTANRQTVGSSNSTTPFPSTPGRPTRTLFSRGPAAQIRSEPTIDRLTPLKAEDLPSSSVVDSEQDDTEDQSATLTLPSEFRGRRRDDTIRASALPSTLTTRNRPSLLPGHFIAATTDSPSSSVAVSPFPSPPATPPTARRGRSSSSRQRSIDERDEPIRGRHASVAVENVAGTPDPRGRSKLRGDGAVHRSFSPSTNDEEEERRSSSRSRSSRASRSRGRGGGREEETPRVRGRTKERTLIEEYDGDEDRGRGRGRFSESRSQSRLRRGRGREVVYSAGAYGHGDSSGSDR